MEFVVEDPQREGGITTYRPAAYDYDDATEMWSLRLGDSEGDLERWIPRERVVYVEGDLSDR